MVPKTSGVVWEYLGDEKTSSALLWNIQSLKTTLPERQKGLENTFLWGLQEDPESASQTNKKPMWSTRQTGSAFFLKPYKFQMTCWWLLTFASCTTETSFTLRPRITCCLLGEWNLLKFPCWLQDLSPGTVCFHRKRKCYRQTQFSLPCCSSDSKQIWISCIRYD